MTDILPVPLQVLLMRLGRLGRGLMLLPVSLVGGGKADQQGYQRHVFDMFSPSQLRRQISIEAVHGMRDELEDFSDTVMQMAAEGNWHGLSRLYTLVESERRETGWGASYYEVVADLIEEWVLNGADGFDNGQSGGTLERLSRLTEAQERAGDDHALAVLTARAHCAVGWAYRGSGWAEDVSDEGWDGVEHHCGVASRIVEQFDPFACNSPGLAAARHASARWYSHKFVLSKSYQDWQALDPTCPELYAAHPFFALPRWDGSYFEIEVIARRAVQRTRAQMGHGAYALIYLGLIPREPEVIRGGSASMFEQGIHDLIEAHPHPVMINRCLLVAAILVSYLGGSVSAGGNCGAWLSAANRVIALLAARHLDRITLESWEDETAARQVIGYAFQDALQRGAQLEFRAGHPVRIREPQVT